jgi:hypothetical protein
MAEFAVFKGIEMPYQKRAIEDSVRIDGIELRYSLLREQQWCTADGWQGPAVLVEAIDGKHRELLLQYPWKKKRTGFNNPTFPGWTRPDYQYRPNLRSAKIEHHIRQAIAAGWDPLSRGKRFVFEIIESPE